ncbi:hypothetical protein PHET_00209 [Paragonimus heterotremus]|uniref:Protein kinase domain-containing protein n=1 Tax=Paragonimus heterotremus TaxID=100268 RepID=A0A8J4TT79_9TREM|nr:hypothetical protein PHET_00209 [Paragonimus heterotremus]
MARPDTRFAAPECLSLTTGWAETSLGSRRMRPNPEGQATDYDRISERVIVGGKIGKSPTTSLRLQADSGSPQLDRPGPWSDMFSLGLVICSLYTMGEPSSSSLDSVLKDQEALTNSFHSNLGVNIGATQNGVDGQTPATVERNPDVIRAKQLSKDLNIPEAFRLAVTRMPLELVEPVEKMLSRSTTRRPTSQLFSLVGNMLLHKLAYLFL